MRTPSKHGLERKYKPWRRGKSSSEGSRGSAASKRPATNASLRNRLRGQRRLLARLRQKNGEDDGNDGDGNGDGATEGVRRNIRQLEAEIEAWEGREREKKNAAKYHQVKFIERQKLTRLEKSVKRRLGQLQERQQSENENRRSKKPEDSPDAIREISELKRQLEGIAMDQLYIAFYPTHRKYMAIFTNNKYERVVDNERGRKRRRGAWDDIRKRLREELGSSKSYGDGCADGDGADGRGRDGKGWVHDLRGAREALLALPPGAYPNEGAEPAPLVAGGRSSAAKSQKREGTAGAAGRAEREEAGSGKKGAAAASSDGRFALSRELDGMFGESTTGEDYDREASKATREGDEEGSDTGSSSGSDSNSDESEDDADPLEGLQGERKEVARGEVDPPSASSSSSSSSPSSSSAASSSSEDDDSSDSDSSSDSDADAEPTIDGGRDRQNRDDEGEPNSGNDGDIVDDDGGGRDDFFATSEVSAGDVFAAVERNQATNGRPDGARGGRRPDKSRGFASQNQSRREYREFRNGRKRQRGS